MTAGPELLQRYLYGFGVRKRINRRRVLLARHAELGLTGA